MIIVLSSNRFSWFRCSCGVRCQVGVWASQEANLFQFSTHGYVVYLLFFSVLFLFFIFSWKNWKHFFSKNLLLMERDYSVYDQSISIDKIYNRTNNYSMYFKSMIRSKIVATQFWMSVVLLCFYLVFSLFTGILVNL